jgi:hypothetical protein
MHFKTLTTISIILFGGAISMPALGQEKQITFSPMGHDLDNNDNFSPDGKWLCYDTRETVEFGIHNSQSVMMVNIETGEEIVLLEYKDSIIGKQGAAPGIGAITFNHAKLEVAFIHGPTLDQVATRGPYDFPNRTGGHININIPGKLDWLDHRDIATDRDTLPGSLRGGTHRHEYTWNGNRIGFTYNDFLMQNYDRTVGYMEPRPDAPGGASHYTVLMVPTVPIDTAKPGEIEKAWADSWVGRDGRMRAFIARARAADGINYEQSLFVADIPLNVDITTADSGNATRYPTPPKEVTIRRLTQTWADGIVRGTLDGKWITYYAKAPDDSTQAFMIPSDGSAPAKQITSLPGGITSGLRWHPTGNSILCISNNAIVATCTQEGPNFGKSVFLTDQATGTERTKLALSWDGTTIAYNRPTPTPDAQGNPSKNYLGEDHIQIFVMPFPDTNADGIVD